MSAVIALDICIHQGAQYFAEYRRVEARYLLEALSGGVSSAAAPDFLGLLPEIDSTIADGAITWINRGRWSPDVHPDVDVWLPSRSYGRRAKVVTPTVPVDLTGYTGDFQLRATTDSPLALHTGVVTFGVRTNGEFKMIIATAVTRTFTFNNAVYDLELITPEAEVDFVLKGNARLSKEVTRVEL